MESIKIGNRIINKNNPTYIIAEVGLNHQGDFGLAKKLIDASADAGADCVKFQKRSLGHVYKNDVIKNIDKEEHGSHYVLRHIIKTELSENNIEQLKGYANKKGIDFICTPWDEKSLRFLSSLNLPAYKIGSPDMFNLQLIRKAALLKKPLIISTGMSFVSEIDQVISYLNSINAKYALLHCNSTYPAPYHDINLEFLKILEDKSGRVVGYSGHEPGISVVLAAVSMGARIIEKHITLNRTLPGPDHKASLEPDEFKEMVKQVRIVETALGEPVRFPSRGEYLNREILSKSIVAAKDIKIGTVINHNHLALKSPGKGTNPLKINNFIGKKLLRRNLKKDDYVLESDVEHHNIHEQSILDGLDIKHRWGIVCRTSDLDELTNKCKPKFVEIHFTDSDVIKKVPYKKYCDMDVVFHGPEYNEDLLLDVSSLNSKIRLRSINFINKSLDYARELKKSFRNKNKRPFFILHPGGMSMDKPLFDKLPELYRNLEDSLKKLNSKGLEILVENMPGRPWYFGGQWYHSSFMDSKEIVKFSKKTGYGIIFDTSHAALYCNLYNKSMEDFTKTILPVTKYVHISDAARYNGEGLQIGDGNINFKPILNRLVKTKLQFLPEIWQGHKFGGEGFLKAIHNLKSINSDF